MKRQHLILLNIGFWMMLVFNETFSLFRDDLYHLQSAPPFSPLSFIHYFVIKLVYFSTCALCFYGSALVVTPLIFTHKKYLKALFAFITLYTALVCWRYILEFFFLKPVLHFDNYRGNTVSVHYYLTNIFWYYFPQYYLYGSLYYLAVNWLQQRRKQEAMEKEKLVTELAFLRSQINPHFLFNTINDIYALTWQQSEKAPEALLKLSRLLRYMLRESTGNLVPLRNEIDHLQNLVELQRLGLKDKAFIQFETEGYIGKQLVAPLLFVTFVENAFKHGELQDPDHPVIIRLKATSRQVELTVINKIAYGQKDETGGIGLHNVKRRLDLLYSGKYLLNIQSDGLYKVHLQLPVST